DRIRHEHHGQTHPARARRLKPSGTLTNDHTDNEVQQNVTTPNTKHRLDEIHFTLRPLRVAMSVVYALLE
ncbi:hypothetical protein, partial [Bifidobacterium longum]|uniref:hypothetical protein n=1 Tax=Bifidobacterium longum TaxID=216816 RepID=UPI003DA4A484